MHLFHHIPYISLVNWRGLVRLSSWLFGCLEMKTLSDWVQHSIELQIRNTILTKQKFKFYAKRKRKKKKKTHSFGINADSWNIKMKKGLILISRQQLLRSFTTYSGRQNKSDISLEISKGGKRFLAKHLIQLTFG